MNIHVHQVNSLSGEATVPGDKSISHRAVLLGSVAQGRTHIEGFLPGEDCLNTIACMRKLGVSIEQPVPTEVFIEGQGWEDLKEPQEVLNVGNSGTTIRLLTGILAGRPFHSVLTGDASIARRPMKRVTEPMRQMGAHIDGRNGGNFTPLAIRGGHLRGITYISPVASAQVKSAVLLAGLQASGTTSVTEPSLSRDHTERMLKTFGVEIKQASLTVSVKGTDCLQGGWIQVPGDISSAAYLLSAATMLPKSSLLIKNVGVNPTRTGILDILQAMGGVLVQENLRNWGHEPVADVYVKGGKLHGTTIAGALIPRCIDEIPVIAVLATQAEGRTVIRDAQELRVKETDRIATVTRFLSQMGAQVKATDDGMIIEGPSMLRGCQVDTAGDHRIGMAAFVAGLVATGETTIEHAEAINVSFPSFEQVFKRLAN